MKKRKYCPYCDNEVIEQEYCSMTCKESDIAWHAEYRRKARQHQEEMQSFWSTGAAAEAAAEKLKSAEERWQTAPSPTGRERKRKNE